MELHRLYFKDFALIKIVVFCRGVLHQDFTGILRDFYSQQVRLWLGHSLGFCRIAFARRYFSARRAGDMKAAKFFRHELPFPA